MRAGMVAGVVSLVVGLVTPAEAQIGIGPRLTFVRGAGGADGSQRFSGGFIRFGSGKTAVEIAMDYRSGLTGDLTERVRDYPIQASLLVYPVRARISPYLLGGVGWYSQNVERVSGTSPIVQETTRRRGYHAGFGAEVRLARHFGLHGDYRYTLLGFGDDDASDESASTPRLIPFAERLKLSHKGSMFAWGATLYF